MRLRELTASVTILPTVSDLQIVGANSILYVDGSWLQSVSTLDPAILSLVIGKVLQGVPTVVARGNPSLLGDSIPGLFRWRAPGLPLIVEGTKITSTLAEGTRQAATLQVLAGFEYAIAESFNWAEQQLSQASALLSVAPVARLNSRPSRLLYTTDTTIQTGAEPSWKLIHRHITSTGDLFAPVGRVSSTFTVYRLENDGSETFKWFNFFFNQTIQPGFQIYNSEFRTTLEDDRVRVNQDTNLVVDHGPTGRTVEGGKTVTYTIGVVTGVLGAAVNASQTQSYFLKQATITDLKQDFEVGWIHDTDARTDSGKITYQIIPGWTVRVLSDRPVDLTGGFTTSFDRMKGDTVAETRPLNILLTAQGG